MVRGCACHGGRRLGARHDYHPPRAARRHPARVRGCGGRRTASTLGHTATFDWLCEQGHVGLERVAKARRDPAIVAPVIAALEVLGSHLRAAQGRRVGAARRAREPAAAGRPRPRADRNGGRGRRRAALHLVPAARRSTSTRPASPSASTSTSTARCAASWRATSDASVARPGRQGLRLRRRAAERAYHDALLDLAAPAMGHPPRRADRRAGRRRRRRLRACTARRCCR